MSKIIVFGGAGFIGSHLLKRLADLGQNQIVSIDCREPRTRLEGVQYINADVRDLGGLNVDGPITTIYNLAAIHTTPGHPTHEYYDTNIAGATEITAFARRYQVIDIVFTSSISVYGPSEDTKTEQSPPAPESAYGWSKLLAEKIHRAWLREASDRRLVIVRPAVVFGPNEGGNFSRLAKMLKKGIFIFPGRTDTIKACIYVDDLLDAIMFARGEPENYTLFNGAYPDRYTIAQIVQTFRANHFPKAKTFVFPKFLIMFAASILRPISASGIGIHPDRILKLVRSTDILPGWLQSKGQSNSRRLELAFQRWSDKTNGQFD